MSFDRFLLAVESCDLFQADKSMKREKCLFFNLVNKIDENINFAKLPSAK